MSVDSRKGNGVGKTTKEATSCMMPLQLLLNVLIADEPLQCSLMYVDVKVNCKEVLALLDISATHNFIAGSRVVDLGLKVLENFYQVKGLNSATQPVGKCLTLLNVGNWQRLCEFRMVVINDFDMILGSDLFVKA